MQCCCDHIYHGGLISCTSSFRNKREGKTKIVYSRTYSPIFSLSQKMSQSFTTHWMNSFWINLVLYKLWQYLHSICPVLQQGSQFHPLCSCLFVLLQSCGTCMVRCSSPNCMTVPSLRLSSPTARMLVSAHLFKSPCVAPIMRNMVVCSGETFTDFPPLLFHLMFLPNIFVLNFLLLFPLLKLLQHYHMWGFRYGEPANACWSAGYCNRLEFAYSSLFLLTWWFKYSSNLIELPFHVWTCFS